jgi:AcrR family transcriptional regulator
MTPIERPRVEGDREDEILEVTIDLLTEVGYDRLTMDAVAKSARASKATLYRRWESKPSLVIDALIRAKDMPEVEAPDTGSLRGDLISAFCGNRGITNHRITGVMGAVITAVSTDPEFADLFREHFIAPKEGASRAIYQRAIERGEIAADVDLEIIAPALAGVCLHRMYVMGQVPDDDVVERVIDSLILPALGATPAPSTHHTSASTPKKTARKTS